MLRNLTGLIAIALLALGCAYGSLPYGSERPIMEDIAVRGRIVDAASGEAIEGARVTVPDRRAPLSTSSSATPADGRFDLRTSVVLGIRGRSPLAGIPTDPLPPRRPALDLRVEIPDGRALDIERPPGRGHRVYDGLLVYELGTIRMPALD